MVRPEDPAPSPTYSGERGKVRVTSDTAGFDDPHQSSDRPVLGAPRRSPLSHALSPAYRGEGEKCYCARPNRSSAIFQFTTFHHAAM
jgi:hypothetical protein